MRRSPAKARVCQTRPVAGAPVIELHAGSLVGAHPGPDELPIRQISLHAQPRAIVVRAIAKEHCTGSTTARLLPPYASGAHPRMVDGLGQQSLPSQEVPRKKSNDPFRKARGRASHRKPRTGFTDDGDDADPLVANQFGSAGNACARQIPPARNRVFELRR